MIPKELQEPSCNASPSSFLMNEQPSEMSFNPSLVKKSEEKAREEIKKSSVLKKRPKFDIIDTNDMAEVIDMVDDNRSESNNEIEFEVSNCLNKMNLLIRSKEFEIFYIIVLFLFMANCIIEAAEINDHIKEITYDIDFGLQIFFTLTILIKFTQFENLEYFWITIDIMTNISGYLSFGLKELEEPVRYLRAIKTLRLILLIKEVNYLKVPATKLITSLSSVGKILFPAALFIYFYAVIGLYSFRDYEYSKCRDPSNQFLTQNWTVYESQVFLCGEKSCPSANGIKYECLNPIDYGVEPNFEEVENIVQGYGLMRYNNIFFSLFSTFKQTFITGSSRLMILGKQVTNYFYVLIYYLSFIYLLAYIYLNIFYGLLITNEEESIDEKKEADFELKIYRASLKKISYVSDHVKEEIEEKESDESETPQPIIKKTSSYNEIENLNSCSSMIREDNINNEKVIDSKEVSSNQLETPEDKNSFRISNKENIIITSNQETGIESADEQTSEENLIKYGEIMKKYYFVNHVIVILCSFNIFIDWEGQTYDQKFVVDTIDFAFFWIYMAEMIFMFIVHRVYVPNEVIDRASKIDFFIFFLCACGQAYEVATAKNVNQFLMASDEISKLLRTIKYLRIFVLISSTPYFKEARTIFNSTLEAAYSVRYLSGLWLLILIVFSIMGVHMFQGKIKVDNSGHLDMENGHAQYIGFEGIVDSIIFTVFIFFNEEWDYFLFQQYVSQQFWIVIWVLIVLVIGLQVLSKYFMAMLMKELGDKLNEQDELDEFNEEAMIEAQNELEQVFVHSSFNQNKISPLKEKIHSPYTFKLKQKQTIENEQVNVKTSSKNKQRKSRFSINPATGLLDMQGFITEENLRKAQEKKRSMIRNMIFQNENEKLSEKQNNKVANNFYEKNGISEPYISWLEQSRVKLIIALKSTFFKVIKILVIVVSIICTLATSPMNDPNSEPFQVYTKIWYATMVFFCLEIFISIFAFGPFNEKGGYFRSFMNWIFVIVFIIEVISIIPSINEDHRFESILSFRIFRIFYFIQLKYEYDADMRLTMVSFWKLLPKILNLLVITIVMYGFFAIILVKLYKDDYYYCDGYDSNATITTEKDCMNWGGSWVQRKLNVSNILNSLLYLFLVATTEGWSTQVIESASLAGEGMEPTFGKNIWIEYFFSVFFFLGNLIMLNVFIGLSVYNFQKIKSQVTGISRLSKNDKMWLSIKNTIHRLSPKMKDSPPENCLSQYAHRFKHSMIYKVISIFLFIVFMVSMSLYMTNMSNHNEEILDTILTIFVGIFIFEYALSWIALGMRVVKYKKFIFETISIIYFVVVFGLTYDDKLEPKLDRILHGIVICLLALRYFARKIFVIFIVLNDVEFIRKMINSLLSVFPETYNIWLLIFLTLFTYSVIGIYFFGYLKIGSELNEFDQNYTDLAGSIYALIKFSTLEAPISQITESTSLIEPNSVCFDIYSYDDFLKYGRMGCGNRVAGYIFFISFLIIYSMILMATLLAVIVDAYSEVRREEESMVNKFQLEEVQKEWENYDPEATGYIGYRDFWMFTAKLVKIYKVNKEDILSHDTKQSFLKSLEIPIYEDENGVLSFQFHEVVEALTKIVLKQKMGPEWNTKEADKVFKNNHQHGSSGKLFKRSAYDSSHVLTLIVMKSGLKAWRRKAIHTENQQQNLKSLFTITKKEEYQPENNNEKNFNPIENSKQSSRKEEPPSQEIEKSQNLKNSKFTSSDHEKMRIRKPIEAINFEKLVEQEKKEETDFKTEELFENSHFKSPEMGKDRPEKKEARKIVTASEGSSKNKNNKDNIKIIQSDRLKQNLNFKSSGDKQHDDEDLSELEEIK